MLWPLRPREETIFKNMDQIQSKNFNDQLWERTRHSKGESKVQIWENWWKKIIFYLHNFLLIYFLENGCVLEFRFPSWKYWKIGTERVELQLWIYRTQNAFCSDLTEKIRKKEMRLKGEKESPVITRAWLPMFLLTNLLKESVSQMTI